MRVALLVGLAACSSHPPAAPLANVPKAPAVRWCLAKTDKIFDGDGAPILCHDDGPCARLDVQRLVASPVEQPPEAVATTLRGDTACIGGACRPLGPHVRDEIAAARKDREDAVVEATADLATIVVGHHAWSIAADAPLRLPPPTTYAKRPNAMVSVTVMGNVLLADWYDCAGPCHEARVTTSTGAPTGVELDGYTTAFRASKTLFAVVSGTELVGGTDMVTLVDGRAGARRGAAAIQTSEEVRGVVVLDSTSVALLRAPYEKDPVLQRITFGAKETTEDVRLPVCE